MVIDRTERQTQVLHNWVKSKCLGSFIGATGFGI